jgi:radical SAM protein with 4Fe4S-binding SPASM domain
MNAGRMFNRLTERALAARAPLSALFELTGRCNLDCGHCYLDIAHPPDELSTDEAKRVVDQLAAAGTLFLTLTGGELFLRKDALEIAAHARRRGLALRLFTNATRVTRAMAIEIARLRPMAVEVSIYGTHAAAHDSVARRRDTLRRTLRGMLYLVRAGVKVGLKAPLLAGVASEVDRLYALADRIGVPMVFDPLVKPRNDADVAPLAMRATAGELAAALSHPRMGLLGQALPEPRAGDAEPCAIARRTTKIAANGDVFPCPTWPEAVGNLRNRSFVELWSGGPLLDRLRAIRVGDLRGDCAGCGQSGYCGRCAAVALLEHGDALGPARESCRVADAKEQAAGVVARRDPSRGNQRVRLRVV